jgi:hypothetical protein
VRVDGKRPSEFPELYVPTRTFNPELQPSRPILMKVGAAAPRVVEEWTLTATDFNADRSRFTYAVVGSVTGPDGEGDSTRPFVSKSGRVAIDPADIHTWALNDSMDYHRAKRLVVRWNVARMFADTAVPPPDRGPGLAAAVTVAQGLRPGRHVLELSGGPDNALEAVRVFRPPLRPAD